MSTTPITAQVPVPVQSREEIATWNQSLVKVASTIATVAIATFAIFASAVYLPVNFTSFVAIGSALTAYVVIASIWNFTCAFNSYFLQELGREWSQQSVTLLPTEPARRIDHSDATLCNARPAHRGTPGAVVVRADGEAHVAVGSGLAPIAPVLHPAPLAHRRTPPAAVAVPADPLPPPVAMVATAPLGAPAVMTSDGEMHASVGSGHAAAAPAAAVPLAEVTVPPPALDAARTAALARSASASAPGWWASVTGLVSGRRPLSEAPATPAAGAGEAHVAVGSRHPSAHAQ